MTARIAREHYGTTPSGQAVAAFTMANARGMEIRCIEYGGIILSITVPDRDGASENVVLGYDTLEGYLRDTHYVGALIGRYANRIAGGRFTLDGLEYRLPTNDGPNHLHGGSSGFHRMVWRGDADGSDEGAGVTLTYTSRDGEQGYPGRLAARVRYVLTDDNQLIVDCSATTDRPTPVGLTQHSYFNLSADGRDILAHELTLAASRFTPVDATLIPTGELRGVADTPFDFRRPTTIGARIAAVDEQLVFGGGYDHNWVIDRGDARLRPAARLYAPASGRVLEILTTEPGIQFYSGNLLDARGAAGKVFRKHAGLALEPQRFPDTPNHPAFPSALLRPGEDYTAWSVYRFSIEAGR